MKDLPTGEDSEERIAPERDIDIDGDYPDSLFDDRTRDAQLERLRHRMTMLSILVPCVLCALLLIGYLDLRYRVSQIQTTGSKKVESLSEDIVDKIESLSYQYETLDSSVTKALVATEESFTLIRDGLKKNEQDIETLTTASETVGKALSLLEGNMAGHKDSLDKLEKELGGRLNEDGNILTALQNDLMGQTKEMGHLMERIEAMQEEAQIQETAIRHLLENKVDNETLDHSLGEERASYEEEMLLLEEKIKSIGDELLWLGKRIDVIHLGVEGHEAVSPDSEGASGTGTKASAEIPTPRGIREQEITE
ncbi:MAG: hypothetical protein SWH78_09340 [Thermodesulfobacteriota bacterium]|nr:hypothetical protein [Thermodesulfobacteriota bacterium]